MLTAGVLKYQISVTTEIFGQIVVFGNFYVRFSPVEVTISQKNSLGMISDLTGRPEKNGNFHL